jgi:hypothetical protein
MDGSGDTSNTRDLAVTAISEIRQHAAMCVTQNAENDKRWDRMFSYIRETHTATQKQITDLSADINDVKTAAQAAQQAVSQTANLATIVSTIQTTMSEQRGANRVMKTLWAGGIALLSGLSGFIGVKLGH